MLIKTKLTRSHTQICRRIIHHFQAVFLYTFINNRSTSMTGLGVHKDKLVIANRNSRNV